jgi:hypothetical protein
MDRVIKDHVESGYIRKVEYRAVKEPDQEIDYIIRYYPGLGASESTTRIQSEIHRKKTWPKRLAEKPYRNEPRDRRAVSAAAPLPSETLALSLITAHHRQLMSQLMFEFGIGATKAYELAVTKMEIAILQLDAWGFREIKPRNRAGWMIQAIENNYDVPALYLDHRNKQLEYRKRRAADDKTRSCPMCDERGFRLVRNVQYPSGAMRQCTHASGTELDSSSPISSMNMNGN